MTQDNTELQAEWGRLTGCATALGFEDLNGLVERMADIVLVENRRPTQYHDALEEMQAHCWHYADALTRITRLVPVKLESGGGRAEFEQAKFIAKTALTNLPTPQAGKLAEDWERLTGCAAAMGYSSLEDMVEKIASLYVTGRLPTPQAEAAPLVQWGTQRLNPKWAEAAPDDGLVAETVKRALISYLFEACQPDRGDVFSWMDDHADDVVVTILTALRARPSGDGEVLPKAGDA